MDSQALIHRLAAGTAVFQGLVHGVSKDQAIWRPSPKKWSILEVVNHLYDEEREDFRRRIDLILHRTDADWPPIDPEGWVASRDYGKREIEPSLRNFVEEREKSIAWLKELGEVDWGTHKDHPAAGRMTAGDLLGAWAAHDYLHIRQLARLHYDYVSVLAEPHGTAYAGRW
jgi:hypothetical protein